MPESLVYVDVSEVREGSLEELKAAIGELVDLIEANVPQILAYNVFLSDDGREMTVVHVHAEPGSLDQHLEAGGAAFRSFAGLLTLKTIDVYGEPSASAVALLREKARDLGPAELRIHPPVAGFSRLEPIAKLD